MLRKWMSKDNPEKENRKQIEKVKLCESKHEEEDGVVPTE
jgi:hypothetical protein